MTHALQPTDAPLIVLATQQPSTTPHYFTDAKIKKIASYAFATLVIGLTIVGSILAPALTGSLVVGVLLTLFFLSVIREILREYKHRLYNPAPI